MRMLVRLVLYPRPCCRGQTYLYWVSSTSVGSRFQLSAYTIPVSGASGSSGSASSHMFSPCRGNIGTYNSGFGYYVYWGFGIVTAFNGDFNYVHIKSSLSSRRGYPYSQSSRWYGGICYTMISIQGATVAWNPSLVWAAFSITSSPINVVVRPIFRRLLGFISWVLEVSVISLVQFVNRTQAIPISRSCCRGFFGIPAYSTIPIPMAIVASFALKGIPNLNNGSDYYKIASSRITGRCYKCHYI